MGEAVAIWQAALDGVLEGRRSLLVRTDDALGMTASEAVYARLNSPLTDSAAMDGIAVASARTKGASEVSPVFLSPEEYRTVDTGDPILPPCDAVVMAEDIIGSEGDVVELRAAAAPWQHVRPIGEDIVSGEMIVPGGRRLTPFDLGVLLSGGITEVGVFARPRVAVIPTGTEIVEAGGQPVPGEIIESNSRMLAGLVTEDGGVPARQSTVPDDYGLLRESFRQALAENDMLIVIAGSSAGTEDYTASILAELGQVVVHGVAMKPGKPVILAIVDGKPAVGIPGYPVSAYIAYTVFARMAVHALAGSRGVVSAQAKAVVTRRIVSSLKHREYVRVRLGRVDGRLVATPLARGAGAAMSLVRADGFCVVPQDSEGVEAGETVRIELLPGPRDIDSTIVCTGSHDLLLDVIDDLLTRSRTGVSVSGTHVGSLGGLLALKNGEAHIAPTHLLDPKTGAYNIPDLHALFGQDASSYALIKGVGRTQGILVRPGNPLGIRSIEDLARPAGGNAGRDTAGSEAGFSDKPGEAGFSDKLSEAGICGKLHDAGCAGNADADGRFARYVNRQRGAGTRVLFDYRLAQLGIEPDCIYGYGREAATHMAVAAAVAGDSADAGMGVLSAAKAMGLDFIPVGDEEYDFAIPVRFLELPMIQSFLGILRSDALKERLDALGGYTYGHIGDIIYL
ncbi:MAG: molybdopterin biosynthesis protein [Clostridiales Family XIII bacterium]|nr:molybdopterin biosynthesis protein [Clostridiales Family XIII bacterium]